jgi:hypothetical protein
MISFKYQINHKKYIKLSIANSIKIDKKRTNKINSMKVPDN